MYKNNRPRRAKIREKITQFTVLMKELSREINEIFVDKKEKGYQDLIVEMIKALDDSQQIVKDAYYKSLGRIANDN